MTKYQLIALVVLIISMTIIFVTKSYEAAMGALFIQACLDKILPAKKVSKKIDE